MSELNKSNIRTAVRENYGKIASAKKEGCGCGPSCCSGDTGISADDVSRELGYSGADTAAVPEGANMGLGCGNPRALANLRAGETVLDLGSGAGFDSFLAAKEVGLSGRVIGVDMTPEMIAKARVNAQKGEYENVEFRLGEIECMPVADGTIDVIISNCVINLSPDKQKVFAEAYRVLKPGGRLAVSDIVSFAGLPEELQQDIELYSACIGGASSIAEVEEMLGTAGFTDIRVRAVDESKSFISRWAPGRTITDFITSASIEAVKPAAG